MVVYITEIDFVSNVVFTDQGAILEVDTYVDFNDDPCLVEDSVALYYMYGSHTILRYDYTEEDMERIENAFH